MREVKPEQGGVCPKYDFSSFSWMNSMCFADLQSRFFASMLKWLHVLHGPLTSFYSYERQQSVIYCVIFILAVIVIYQKHLKVLLVFGYTSQNKEWIWQKFTIWNLFCSLAKDTAKALSTKWGEIRHNQTTQLVVSLFILHRR